MGFVPSFQASKKPGVEVFESLRAITEVRLTRRAAILASIMAGIACISILVFFFFGNSRTKRVLFFPAQGQLVSEQRFLPNHGDIEGDMTELIREEILGPVSHDAQRLMSKDVTLKSLFVRNHVAYIDLSADFFLEQARYPLGGEAALEVLRKAVRFNFPHVREVVFTADGQVPNFSSRK
jgi:hypothetical protein